MNTKEWIAKLTTVKAQLEIECPHVAVNLVGAILDLRVEGLRGSVGLEFEDTLEKDVEKLRTRVEFTNANLKGRFLEGRLFELELLAEALRICKREVDGITVNIKE